MYIFTFVSFEIAENIYLNLGKERLNVLDRPLARDSIFNRIQLYLISNRTETMLCNSIASRLNYKPSYILVEREYPELSSDWR